MSAPLPPAESDAGVTLTDAEWVDVCRAAGEHTEDACDALKVAVEQIVAGRIARVLPPGSRNDNERVQA